MAGLPKFVVVEKNVNLKTARTTSGKLADQEYVNLTKPSVLKKNSENKIENFDSRTKTYGIELKNTGNGLEYAHVDINIKHLIGGEKLESLDLSQYTLKTHTFKGSKNNSYSEIFIFERITPETDSAGGGSRKSKRKARKSRRSNAKKSSRRNRK